MSEQEQAGDPFGDDDIQNAKVNMTAEQRDGVPEETGAEPESTNEGDGGQSLVDEIQVIQDSLRQSAPELEGALEALEKIEEEKAAESKAEAEAENVTLEEARAIVRVTAQAVEDATVNLEKANKAYQIASQLEVVSSVKPTLAELNRAQVKVTATEVRRKGRAMKALGELGFGQNLKPKPYPQLF